MPPKNGVVFIGCFGKQDGRGDDRKQAVPIGTAGYAREREGMNDMAAGPLIYLLRHGETLWNRERRMQGRRDSPLTERGIAQAAAMGEALRARLGDGAEGFAWRSSPLMRAWQTAVIVAGRVGVDPGAIERQDALREMTWGDWDGLTAAEIEARDPQLWQARINDRFTIAPPGGGETQTEIVVRAATWLRAVPADAKLVVVAHGALGRALRTAFEGAHPKRMLELDEPQDAFYRLSDAGIERLGVA